MYIVGFAMNRQEQTGIHRKLNQRQNKCTQQEKVFIQGDTFPFL